MTTLKTVLQSASLLTLAALLPSLAGADSNTYAYTGNPLSSCTTQNTGSGSGAGKPPVPCAGSGAGAGKATPAITGSFTLGGESVEENILLAPDLDNFSVTPSFFSFGIDGDMLTQVNTSASFLVTTNDSGQIIAWDINISGIVGGNAVAVQTQNEPSIDSIQTIVGGLEETNSNSNDAGVWTGPPVGVPEPSSFGMLGFGLIGLAMFRLKKALA
jgi:PEP-CTERM motif